MASFVESISPTITSMGSKAEQRDNEENEAIIKFFLETYKDYIVQCISYEDLLFYRYFSPEKRKYFRGRKKAEDCKCITSEMIETIIGMEGVPDRFSSLVKLFEDEFENEKVRLILTGQKVPTNRKENKETILRVFMREICENLCIHEIIPELINHELILPKDGQSLKNKAEHKSPFTAAIDLLLILPMRHSNWYGRFIACLIKSGHQQLAEAVDKGFCEKILKRQTVEENIPGEHPKDYEDEKMSLASGPMKTRTSLSEMKRRCMIKPSNLAVKDAKQGQGIAETELTTGNQKAISLDNQRVYEWLKDGKSIVSESDMERGDSDDESCETRMQKCFLNKKVFAERSNSLLTERTSHKLHRVKSKRHPTSLVQISQTERLQKSVSEQNYVYRYPIKHGVLYSQSSSSSRRSSVVSNSSSSETLCVDNCHLSISQTDLDSVHIESTDSPQKADSVALPANTAAMSGEILRNVEISSEDAEKSSDSQCASIVSDNTTDAKGQKTYSCFPILEQLFNVSCLHPVKISIVLKEHPELQSTCKLLEWMSNRTMEYDDDLFALKAHYISTVIQMAKEAEHIDLWIDNLLTGRRTDGYYEFQDQMIREMLNKFKYKDSEIYKNMLSQLHAVPLGDGLSSLKVLIERLSGTSSFVSKNITRNTRNNDEEKSQNYREEHTDHEKSQLSNCRTEICNCIKEESSLQLSSGFSLQRMPSYVKEYVSIKEQMAKINCMTTSVQWIRNGSLWTKYMRKKVLLAENGGNANERFLFHKSQFRLTAIEEGFQALNKKHSHQKEKVLSDHPFLYEMFLENSTSSSTCKARSCMKRMLICRVSLGKIAQGSGHSTDKGIADNCHSVKTRLQYNGKVFCTYSVISGDQIYPEYLVKYKMDHTET